MYALVATPGFSICVARLRHFLSVKYSSELAAATLSNVRSKLESTLPANPESGPVSERLIALGIKGYRQLLIDKHNLVFYRVEHEKRQIVLLAIMDSRQDVQKLLHEVLLLL